MKKPISQYTEEELLAALNAPETISSEDDEISEFISCYNLKSGPNNVSSSLVSKLYQFWPKHTLNNRTFGRRMADFIPPIKSYYHLNLSAAEIKVIIRPKNHKPVINLRKYKENFETYILHYNLKKGGLYIMDLVLYNIYDKWNYQNNTKNPLKLQEFNRFCNLYFTNKLVKGRFWYKLNKSILDHLSENLINLMKNRKNKKLLEQYEKEIKKKRSPISSS